MMITWIIYHLFKTIVFLIDEVIVSVCLLKKISISLPFFIIIWVFQMRGGQCWVLFLVLKM